MLNINFAKITEQINAASNRINAGGYDNNINQKFDRSSKNENIAVNNQFISANLSIKNNSDQAAKILENINDDLDKFRELYAFSKSI